MNDKKPRITDQFTNDQIFNVIQEAEKRLNRYSGDIQAKRRGFVEEARHAFMTWERNGFKTNSISQDSLETAIKELLDSGENDKLS